MVRAVPALAVLSAITGLSTSVRALTAPRGTGAGIAYSGGGISGLYGAMCHQAFFSSAITNKTDYRVSTCSGGTTGYTLYETAGDALSFVRTWELSEITMSDLKTKYRSSKDSHWFGTISSFIPSGAPTIPTTTATQQRRSLSTSSPSFPENWWTDALSAAGRIAYGIKGGNLKPGPRPLDIGATCVRPSQCPLKLNAMNNLENISQTCALAPLSIRFSGDDSAPSFVIPGSCGGDLSVGLNSSVTAMRFVFALGLFWSRGD